MISVRLPKQLERELERAAKREGLSKSELIRQSLEDYFARQKLSNLAWELGEGLFGRHGSGRSDLSQNRKRVVREKIGAKQGDR